MTPTEIIKDQLPKKVEVLRHRGYCVEAFEKNGQVNVYLNGKVFTYYVTTGRIIKSTDKGFSAFLKLLVRNE